MHKRYLKRKDEKRTPGTSGSSSGGCRYFQEGGGARRRMRSLREVVGKSRRSVEVLVLSRHPSFASCRKPLREKDMSFDVHPRRCPSGGGRQLLSGRGKDCVCGESCLYTSDVYCLVVRSRCVQTNGRDRNEKNRKKIDEDAGR